MYLPKKAAAPQDDLLYFVAIERIRHCHYYIFLYDDVDLGFNLFSSQ